MDMIPTYIFLFIIIFLELDTFSNIDRYALTHC